MPPASIPDRVFRQHHANLVSIRLPVLDQAFQQQELGVQVSVDEPRKRDPFTAIDDLRAGAAAGGAPAHGADAVVTDDDLAIGDDAASAEGDGEGSGPGDPGFTGFGEIILRYDEDAILPDGIPWPIRMTAMPATYVE